MSAHIAQCVNCAHAQISQILHVQFATKLRNHGTEVSCQPLPMIFPIQPVQHMFRLRLIKRYLCYIKHAVAKCSGCLQHFSAHGWWYPIRYRFEAHMRIDLRLPLGLCFHCSLLLWRCVGSGEGGASGGAPGVYGVPSDGEAMCARWAGRVTGSGGAREGGGGTPGNTESETQAGGGRRKRSRGP